MATLIAAKEAGASRIVVVEAPQACLDVAKELGADLTINIEKVTEPEEWVEEVRAVMPFGLGADIVFEATGVPPSGP